jgi:hypothetical protein
MSRRTAPQAWLGGETGASLVELLIGIAISTFVVATLGAAVYQFFAISGTGNARMAVLHDLQNAGLWLGRDAQEASSFSAGGGLVYGTFNWSDLSVQFRYSYDPGTTSLIREHLVGGVTQSTVAVARHIASQSDVTFSPSGSLVTVLITSTSGGVSAGDTILLAMRVP